MPPVAGVVANILLGEKLCLSLGTIKILVPTTSGLVPFDVDVVPLRVPVLLGLNLMDLRGLQYFSASNEIQCVPED